MILSTSGTVCLATALMLAPAWQDPAQQAAQAPQAQAQAPPAGEKGAAQGPDQAKPPANRQRPSERQPRTSRRQPSVAASGSFDEARTSRDGGPVRQDLTLLANLQGGYDDNVTAGLGSGSGAAPTAMASGSTAYLNGTLSYFRGNNRHSLALDSTGSLTGFPGYLDDPAPGAVVNVGAMTTAGRDTKFRVSERVGYEPFFNVYSQGASGIPLPPDIGEAAPATGLFERRSWNTNSSAAVEQRWGRRDWTTLSYTYRRQEFADDDYGDNRSHEVQADYRHGLSRGARALLRYRFKNLEYADAEDLLRPTREQRIEAGPEIEKVLSRRRQVTLSFTAGAAFIESISSTTSRPYQDWLPTGRARLRFVLSPAWNVEGGYDRDINTFQGVTDEVYTTDTASLSASGMVTDRVDLRVGATYGNWKTPVASGITDTMDVYGGSVQLQVAISDTVKATAGYYYYYHRYSNPGSLPAGFPAEYDRHAVRVGITLRVPLAGAPTTPRTLQR